MKELNKSFNPYRNDLKLSRTVQYQIFLVLNRYQIGCSVPNFLVLNIKNIFYETYDRFNTE